MKINKNKTEGMMVKRQKEEIKIWFEGEKFKLVTEVKYIGMKIDEKYQMGKKIFNRIQCYTNNLSILYPLMQEKLIPRKKPQYIKLFEDHH